MKILVAGDFCPQHRVAALIEQDDYAFVLGAVKPIVSEADYRIVNFECPVCRGGEMPIEKHGPNLKCTEKGIKAVAWAGFDCVTLANNHFLDYGEEGVNNTLEACKKYNIDVVGGGQNLKSVSSILYKEVGAQKLAIINCCEHEFSIATETSAGSNPLNPIQQYYDIREARSKADYVLVIVHGGHEIWQLPSPRMKQTYQFFIDAGADAVVNHHQHCYSGYEIYKGKPIVYGLGNFCFDKQNYFQGLWENGYMVEIETKTNELTLYPYEQCKEEPTVRLTDNRREFDEQINKLNVIIADNDRLQEETVNYYARKKKRVALSLEPYSNKLLKRLFLHGLIPSFMSKKRKRFLANMVICESQRDLFTYYLNSYD